MDCGFVIASVICVPQSTAQYRGVLDWQVSGFSVQMVNQPEECGVTLKCGWSCRQQFLCLCTSQLLYVVPYIARG